LPEKPKLLWIGEQPAPANVRAAAAGRWNLSAAPSNAPLAEQLRGASVAILNPNGVADDARRLQELLDAVSATPAVAVLLLAPTSRAWENLAGRGHQVLCAPQDADARELAARLDAAAALQPTIVRLRDELAAARQASDQAERTFVELGEEMRLAARLQRDFLPRRLPEVGPARLGVLYRPATWVSGDIYDILRLDETHVGFYVADAVGHGMPAALLTIFIKKALQTKRIAGHSYEIVPPHEALAELNADICGQNLSSCQFCTAVYAVLDVATLTLEYCRAGHPEPLRIAADGAMSRLGGPGCLLGVFPEEQFASQRVQLARGDRVVLFTDGVEDCLGRRANGDRLTAESLFEPLADLPREELLFQLSQMVDDLPGDRGPADDITVLVLDIEP